jgi:hypothetical protein
MKSFITQIIFVAFFIFVLIVLIGYTRGYRLNFSQKTISPTGILVASSYPDGAKIYLNGKLYGATNSNLTLPPGKYFLEIKKDGYSTWKKQLTIKGELVVKADALLFPQNPSLSPITSLGVVKVYFSQNSGKTVIFSQNNDPEKEGIYLLDNIKKPLSIFNPLKLLSKKSSFLGDFDTFDKLSVNPEQSRGVDLKDTEIKFSPDGKQIIFTTPLSSFILSSEEETKQPFDISNSKETIEEAWQKEQEKNLQKILETFSDPLPKIASDSFKIVSFSPDESKILYEATKSATIPLIIDPPLIAANQTKEERTLKKDSLYIYDKKEDKNFEIKNLKLKIKNSILWYPDSQHLIINEEKQISICDYDGENKQAVYSGPFEQDFVAVTSDGKLLILANLNPQTNKLPDVYAVGIK